ncbi:DUF308 domain-containing protein [Mycolicibacterium holsaticum]|uniref:DUF308 domain-containing protein n=1 Tax=Mycolicibacterium holsaticum TaxID=152142 RepID=UPI001C7CD9D6|nr:DUF308 domain-containing protein [Mycolicibacterium holsaticum]MDA4107946.1 hypothetical protein [Mycolicibacterium holsaticum DSM 44478 = JCM 12374]QZA14628.1 DUF308 domain-containing protein [Mycolicibacterium holsaticum DSM 44478 = JCM 12374]UNC07927.1 DUF308 domain-containing protein [Mycolicibacterium holsaticum DSM 44478 = JCM 12374]
MLIVALVLAVIGLAALVTAVVTSNELIAWVCIAASAIGVLLLIVDAVRERSRGGAADVEETPAEAEQFDADYPDADYSDADYADGTDLPEDDAETTVVEQAEENNR